MRVRFFEALAITSLVVLLAHQAPTASAIATQPSSDLAQIEALPTSTSTGTDQVVYLNSEQAADMYKKKMEEAQARTKKETKKRKKAEHKTKIVNKKRKKEVNKLKKKVKSVKKLSDVAHAEAARQNVQVSYV